jgi:ABC-type polar amino acid transport system ATPase subunit
MSIIEFRGVNKVFGDFQVLKDIDFSEDEGRIVEVGAPEHFFQNPQNMRTKSFLDQILY